VKIYNFDNQLFGFMSQTISVYFLSSYSTNYFW